MKKSQKTNMHGSPNERTDSIASKGAVTKCVALGSRSRDSVQHKKSKRMSAATEDVTIEICRQSAVELGVPEAEIEQFAKLDFELHKEGFVLGVDIVGDGYGIGYEYGGDAQSMLTLNEVQDFLTLRHRAKALMNDLQLWLETPGHGAGRVIPPVLLEHRLFPKPCCRLVADRCVGAGSWRSEVRTAESEQEAVSPPSVEDLPNGNVPVSNDLRPKSTTSKEHGENMCPAPPLSWEDRRSLLEAENKIAWQRQMQMEDERRKAIAKKHRFLVT
ncbi:MAG: hypothetical protein AB9869_38395 [Verrucomicrobiia bacterium]